MSAQIGNHISAERPDIGDAPCVDRIAPGFGLDGQDPLAVLDSPMTMVGTVEEIGERLHARRDRWGFSYHVVQGDKALEMAPVVAALAGL